jgi:hypothetical protein
MNTKDRFEDIVRKDLEVRAGDETYGRMHRTVLAAHGPTERTKTPTFARRLLMDKPVVKFALAAVVVAAVVLGLFEFLSPGSTSGVVWADVARKVQASRGVIFRAVSRDTPDPHGSEFDYRIDRYTAMQSRLDKYKGDKIITSIYGDCNTKTVILVDHIHKSYVKMAPEMPDALRMDPNSMVQRFLSCKHTELGQQVIDGVLCEGIETTDPAFHGDKNPPETLLARVWVSVETGYPVKIEGDYARDNGRRRFTFLWDQFQWDAELDDGVFEPNIPAGYLDISP